MALKPQDILVLLKLVTTGNEPWRLSDLADSLGMSTSEVLQSLRRCRRVHLLESNKRTLRIEPLLELLIHSLKYFFPGQMGGQWGKSSVLKPLYRSAPFAANKDPDLKTLLDLVDLLRCENSYQSEKIIIELRSFINQSYNQRCMLPDEKVVLANLSDLGAPLVLSSETAATHFTLSKEETIAAALSLSHRNPTLARVLPLVFFKHKEELNFWRLRRLSENFHEEITLGFFLDLTAELSGNRRLSHLSKPLKKMRPQKMIPFFINENQGKYATLLATSKTPLVAKNWGFQMNMDLSTFQSHFDKFRNVI